MRRLPWFEHCVAQFCYATLNFDVRSHYSLSTCWIWGYTCKTPIIAHIALEQGTLCWLLTAARYIALSLISRYLSLDPKNRDISGLHCIMGASQISKNSESKWPWRSRSMTRIFNNSREYPKMYAWLKLVIPVQICDELLCGQVQFPKNLSQNDLEGQGQWLPFSIPAESIQWCMFGAKLVILAHICDKLLCGQAKVYGRTDGWTDTGYNKAPSAFQAKG